jgi:autotransporter-associated beta strand protein
VVNSAALVFSRSNDATFSGVISGTGGLTKQGGGMLTFSGNNSYTGGTTISDGVLQVGAGGTTGSLAGNAVNNSTIVFNRSNALTYSGVISGTGSIRNAGTGTTTLTGQTSFAVPLVATAGRLIVGSTASVNGFSTSGNLTTASGATLELKSKGLAYVNGLSTLTGGTIRAANGISLGAGANVVGTGVISGFVSAAYGSRAEADGGKLTVGDSSSYVGFASAGLLYTNANEVELLDRNLAVLGALTQLGDGSAAGTLRAANGMLLEQGKNLVGRGTVYGTFVNQGDVYGDGSAAGQQIIFAAGSTVSGIGSFENVVFDGTYSPGNSPAITNLTNGQFSSASSLLIELGGTQPGTQYDRVVDSGVLTLLGGTLDVVLYNGFVPSFGDRFEILQYGQLSGDFGTVSYPALSGGLSWERTTSATAMAITVVPEPSTYAIAAIATAGLAGLMRWRRRPGPRLS